MKFRVGDRVRVDHPDESGVSCILAGYDAAYLVMAVDGHKLTIQTRVAGVGDVVVYAHEVTQTDERPWWEPTR